MTIKELRQLSENELQKILAESRDKLRELNFKATRRELGNVREVRKTRKTIARILTLLRTRKSAANTANLHASRK